MKGAQRSFRWSADPNLQGEVAFYIERPGTVGRGSIRVIEKSGDFSFDLEMLSAVEQAPDRFGPLPEGWIPDKLGCGSSLATESRKGAA
jgi:hypothetical protein